MSISRDHIRIKIWDLPLRIFHWALVVSVVAAVVTAKIGGNLIEWHARLGILIAGLVAFRLVWGLLGSTYARFAQFFPTPAKIAAYLKGRWHGLGHNPLGALSVFGLLAVLTVQIVTGLAANDDIAFSGPWASWVGKESSDWLSGWHRFVANVLIALIALHVLAIFFYAHLKKENLVSPMVTGWKSVPLEEGACSAQGAKVWALLLALGIAGAVMVLASGVCLPEPPPAPPAAVVPTPSW